MLSQIQTPTLIAFLSYAFVLSTYIVSVSNRAWLTYPQNKTYLVSTLGVWEVCWHLERPCEDTVQAVQFHLQDSADTIPHWVFLVRLLTVVATLLAGYGVVVSFKICIDCSRVIYQGASFVAISNIFMAAGMFYFTYNIKKILPNHITWKIPYIVGWCGTVVGVITVVVLITYTKYHASYHSCGKRHRRNRRNDSDVILRM